MWPQQEHKMEEAQYHLALPYCEDSPTPFLDVCTCPLFTLRFQIYLILICEHNGLWLQVSGPLEQFRSPKSFVFPSISF